MGVFNTIPFLASALQLASTVSGSATWPSKYDELEDIMCTGVTTLLSIVADHASA